MLFALLAAACGDNVAGDVGATVTEMCGPAPLAPGWSVGVTANAVTMSSSDYNAILRWRGDVDAWEACVTTLGGP